MLDFEAVLERKATHFPTEHCTIEKIVTLTDSAYKEFRKNLMEYRDFIEQNVDCMYLERNGTRHCLLVLGDSSSDGVVVESEGYGYARYAGLISGARELVHSRLNALADILVREGTAETRSATWSHRFDELRERFGVRVSDDNGVGSILLGILRARPEVASAGLNEEGFEMFYYPDFCKRLQQISAPQEGRAEPVQSNGFGHATGPEMKL